jgi:hypothetical protein
MKLRSSLFLFLIFISAVVAAAQGIPVLPYVCQQPFSNKFDEFSFTNIADARERLQKFHEAVNEAAEAKGYIFVYGGKKSRFNEIAEMTTELRKVLQMGDSYYNSKLVITDYGYRSVPTVELFIRPLNCSENPAGASDFQIQEIEFAEAPAESTLKKSTGEINNSLVKKTESVCPPAARAVRACDNTVEVYVIIDQKGNVIFAKAVSGHPLLRLAGVTTVKNWKFQPAKIKDKAYNAAGYITVEFHQTDETIN